MIPAAVSLREEEYRLLRELIYDHCGLTFADDMRRHVARKLAPRLALHGLADFVAYHRLLRFSPGRRAELEAAAELLTTNETYLFREPQGLRAFSEEILPRLARERAGARRLRVWSAGCSSGEEAYTLAILLLQSGLFPGWKLEVFGTDIARRVLATARAGVYGEYAFRTADAEAVRSWFEPAGAGWSVREEARRIVSFGHLNLLDAKAAASVGTVDVVFCRNVMIYFDARARTRVVRTFHDQLRPGGWLLVGHSESLLQVTTDFELVQLEHDLVYRRPEVSP